MISHTSHPSATDPSGAQQIQKMFSAIAPRYDLLNTLLSLGFDRYWRRELIQALSPQPEERFLDVATGTGDVLRELCRQKPGGIPKPVGIDFSVPMLVKARNKVASFGCRLAAGAAENLPLDGGTFDGVTVAFGLRNFADLDRGLREIHRVLKPGGRLGVLEFSLPRSPALRALYQLYFYQALPLIGRWVSGHPDAYRYLPESVLKFPVREGLSERMQKAGFEKTAFEDLTFGIVTLYQARKRV